MSEAITKECPAYCECGRRVVYDGDMPIDKGPCSTCSGTGRVPDVEATQRAQLDAQRILIERFDAALRGKDSENAELRGDLAYLRTDIAQIQKTLGEALDDERTITISQRAEIVRLTEEVERLKAEKNHARQAQVLIQRARNEESDRSSAAWIAQVKIRDAEVARLTAEVERLSSRLKFAEDVVVQARQLCAYSWEDRLDDSRVSDAAKHDARELEIAVWHYDQLTARLAGCKS